MHILPVYAALLALIYIYLSLRTVKTRQRLRISIGDTGNEEMLRAIRVHANFAEFVPFALLLIFLIENSGGAAGLVHILGAWLVLARLSHAYGLSSAAANFRFRVFGAVSTFLVLLISAIYLLVQAV